MQKTDCERQTFLNALGLIVHFLLVHAFNVTDAALVKIIAKLWHDIYNTFHLCNVMFMKVEHDIQGLDQDLIDLWKVVFVLNTVWFFARYPLFKI